MNDISKLEIPSSVSWEPPSRALDLWAKADIKNIGRKDNVIDITEVIGEDPFTGEGFTAKKLAAILHDVEGQDVNININSPGGSVSEALEIHSRLQSHKGKKTVNILGIAASSASLIAMSGDEINMFTGTMMMVHNAWSLVIGNRHDFAEAAEIFKTIDDSLNAIYVARTNLTSEAVAALMDGTRKNSDGTFMTAEEAVDNGFADRIVEFDDSEVTARVPDEILARREIEAALAAKGYTRQQREEKLKEISGQRDATTSVKRDADDFELVGLLKNLSSKMEN